VPSVNRLYRRVVDKVDVIDLLTAIVYAVALLALLATLGIWWLFLVLAGVLSIGGGWRAARARRARAQR
jgi:hypothetical protein